MVRFRFECRSRRRLHRDAQLFRVLVNHGYKYFLTAPRSAVAPAE